MIIISAFELAFLCFFGIFAFTGKEKAWPFLGLTYLYAFICGIRFTDSFATSMVDAMLVGMYLRVYVRNRLKIQKK